MAADSRTVARRLVGLFVLLLLLVTVALCVPGETAKSVVAIVFLFGGVPLAIVCFVDLVVALKRAPGRTLRARIVAALASVPVFALGVVSIVFGVGIVGSLVYLWLFTDRPEVRSWGVLHPFGIGPALVAVGWSWVSLARARSIAPETEPDREPEPETEPELTGSPEGRPPA